MSALKKVFTKHKTLAMRQVIQNNPNLAIRLKLREAQKNVGKTGSYTDADQLNYLLAQFPK